MKTQTSSARLEREFRRLFRCMDFVARHPALKSGRSVAARRLAEIYQQLGLTWELLALQCRHPRGFTRVSDAKHACPICGTIEEAKERWLLLPREGKKRVGLRRFPDSTATFPSRKSATLVNDSLVFHGAQVRVRVQNAYRSKVPREHAITIAADRIVELREGGVECDVDTRMISVRTRSRKRGEPPFGAFAWELPHKQLRKFPLLLEYDRRGEFVGVCIFRPRGSQRGKPRQGSSRRSVKPFAR
jgi:hypothetical protein